MMAEDPDDPPQPPRDASDRRLSVNSISTIKSIVRRHREGTVDDSPESKGGGGPDDAAAAVAEEQKTKFARKRRPLFMLGSAAPFRISCVRPPDSLRAIPNGLLPHCPCPARWDLSLLLLLLYIAAVMPYRMCFDQPATGWVLYFEIGIDLLFIVDIFLVRSQAGSRWRVGT